MLRSDSKCTLRPRVERYGATVVEIKKRTLTILQFSNEHQIAVTSNLTPFVSLLMSTELLFS